MAEAKALDGLVNPIDDCRGSVVSIQRRGARRLILTVCQEAPEFRTQAFPIAAGMLRKNLRDTSPAHVLYQYPPLIVRGRTAFGVERVRQLDRREVVATFLLLRSFAETVLGANAVVAAAQLFSGGRRMYFSRIISQA